MSSNYDYSSSESEIDDLDLLKSMNREDLFTLIKTDPRYYLTLIKENKLEDQLDIHTYRSSEGSLTIKFRIYPNDDPVEVGYSHGVNDDEVIDEFILQIKLLLNRRKLEPTELLGQTDLVDLDSESELESESECGLETKKEPFSRAHLACQLEGNNDVLSNDYGKDLKKLSKNLKNPMNFTNSLNPENLKDSLNAVETITSLNTIKPPTRKETMIEKPVDTLNNFVALLLDKISNNLPNLVQIDRTADYSSMIRDLEAIKPPKAYLEQHENLLEQIKGYAYLQKVHHLMYWTKYPELQDDWRNFHLESIKKSPNLYSNIKKETLLDLLDEDDRELLQQYQLDIQQIWKGDAPSPSDPLVPSRGVMAPTSR